MKKGPLKPELKKRIMAHSPDLGGGAALGSLIPLLAPNSETALSPWVPIQVMDWGAGSGRSGGGGMGLWSFRQTGGGQEGDGAGELGVG